MDSESDRDSPKSNTSPIKHLMKNGLTGKKLVIPVHKTKISEFLSTHGNKIAILKKIPVSSDLVLF